MQARLCICQCNGISQLHLKFLMGKIQLTRPAKVLLLMDSTARRAILTRFSAINLLLEVIL